MKPALLHPIAVAVLLAWAGTCLSATAQTNGTAPAGSASAPAANGKRPKICLVLSGGGARGAAHTGVLRVLEELRVPIHCITGTSMGALVGGAYATGMSVDEMDAVNADITVAKLFKEKPPRQELKIRRKVDDHINFIGPEIGLGADSALLTKGAVSGVQLETVLRQLSKVRGYYDFDRLPIQYRAVATDLVTGKAVVFREGDIANVMRASMSVPGAVAPAEMNGMILVDGMLTSNLPVDAARALGADVVIAVNVGTPLLKREQLNSILGVAGQMLSILTEQNVQASIASLQPDDILISPELGDFSTGDFDHLEKIAPLGEAAARVVADQLSRYSIPADEYAALRNKQRAPIPPDLLPVDEIRFTNLKHVNPEEAKQVMLTKVNEPIVQEELDGDMRRLYGTGDFEHVNFRTSVEDGRRVLFIDAAEKSWGPNYLRFGWTVDTDFGSEAKSSLLASYRMTWLNSRGAEWRSDLSLGSKNRFRTEFYQPFEAGHDWFVAPALDVSQRLVSIYGGDERLAIYSFNERSAGVDLGRNFYQHGQFRLGLTTGQVRQKLDTGSPVGIPENEQIQTAGVRAGLLMDRLDSVLFPRSGWHARANAYYSSSDLGADLGYTKWNVEATGVYSLGENTFNLLLASGGNAGSNPIPAYDGFQLGGFLRMSGYATEQLLGREMQFGRLMYYRRISRGRLLEGLYGGLSLEMGRVRAPLMEQNSSSWRKAIAGFVGMDTLVGPIYFGAGRTADGASSLYLVLGPAF